MTPFERFIEFLLQQHIEGGHSNDPEDPGGETKYGISKRSYPHLPIKDLTREQVVGIYRTDFWNKCKCNELPTPLAVLVADAAVNQGPEAAIVLLQISLGVVADGVIGPKTIAAAHRCDVRKTVQELVARRAYRYATNKQFHRYGLGWMRRLAECHQLAVEMV